LSLVEESFLTVAEVAERLRLNQQTARNWTFRTVFSVCPLAIGLKDGALTYRPKRRSASVAH
jgi:hypothetical protein